MLATETAAELRARREEMLQEPGDDEYRTSILFSAARISEVLDGSSAAASFAELALAAACRDQVVVHHSFRARVPNGWD